MPDEMAVRVVTPSGKVGYALDDSLSSLDIEQICYVKERLGMENRRLCRRRMMRVGVGAAVRGPRSERTPGTTARMGWPLLLEHFPRDDGEDGDEAGGG